MRRAKIVCTLGPAVANRDGLTSLIDAGMNVARLNLSHGDYSEHEAQLKLVREISEKKGVSVAILVDLQGPDRKSTRLNSSHVAESRMPTSA